MKKYLKSILGSFRSTTGKSLYELDNTKPTFYFGSQVWPMK